MEEAVSGVIHSLFGGKEKCPIWILDWILGRI